MSLKSHFGMVFLWKKMLPYEKNERFYLPTKAS